MATRSSDILYSTGLLARATALAQFPLTTDLSLIGEARSRTCGSTIRIGIETDGEARISRLGMRVSACAVGQAAASVFAKAAKGKLASEIAAGEIAIAAWLDNAGPEPDWPEIGALAAALPHIGRHQAILLPWRAALDALSKAGGAR